MMLTVDTFKTETVIICTLTLTTCFNLLVNYLRKSNVQL